MVLLDQRSNRLFSYNDSASIVWRALEKEGRLDDAIDALSSIYGITREHASRDTAAILEHWQSQGLLRQSTGPKKSGHSARAPHLSANLHRTTSSPTETYQIGGRVFRITIDDDDVAQRAKTLLRPYAASRSSTAQEIEVRRTGAGDLVLICDGAETLRAQSSAEMTGALFQTILSSVHSNNRWLGIIHGGALSREGKALLLPGTSGSGKSTLGAFLMSRGFDYLSDDMIAITREGRIAVWPIPISLKSGSWEYLAPYLPELEALPPVQVWTRTVKYLPVSAASWDCPPFPARLIVFPKFDRAVQRSCLTRLQPLEALQRLISDRMWLGYPLRASSIKRFLDWLGQMPAYELTYGSFEAVEDLVREVLERKHD